MQSIAVRKIEHARRGVEVFRAEAEEAERLIVESPLGRTLEGLIEDGLALLEGIQRLDMAVRRTSLEDPTAGDDLDGALQVVLQEWHAASTRVLSWAAEFQHGGGELRRCEEFRAAVENIGIGLNPSDEMTDAMTELCRQAVERDAAGLSEPWG
ncbi:MAG: hypothetical protein ACRC1K_18410 [Planctomycetia bacterium]